MEADWEIEISLETPVIDAHWSGFVDLRTRPDIVATLEEVQHFPPLGIILLRLNGPSSADIPSKPILFWSAKCDLWTPESIDPDEMEASPAESAFVRACYIDLIPEDDTLFASLPSLESHARRIVAYLRTTPVRCSRVDLVLRQAVTRDSRGFGITAYTTVCGSDGAVAEQALETALDALVEAICSVKAS